LKIFGLFNSHQVEASPFDEHAKVGQGDFASSDTGVGRCVSSKAQATLDMNRSARLLDAEVKWFQARRTRLDTCLCVVNR
jgi:hypothetical protein